MTTINNLLELYSLKGNVESGKIILFQELVNKYNNDYDEIEYKIVDEYQIMGKKHFIRSWKQYQKMKKWISIDD